MYNVVAIVFLTVGVAAGVVSLASSYWTVPKDSQTHYGLFQSCRNYPLIDEILCSNNFEGKHKDEHLENDWFMVCVVCHCVAVLTSFVGCILWFTTFCHLGTGTRATAIFLVIIASACYIAGVVVWTFKYVRHDRHETHGWSFFVATGAAVTTPISAVLMVVSAVSKRGYHLVSAS